MRIDVHKPHSVEIHAEISRADLWTVEKKEQTGRVVSANDQNVWAQFPRLSRLAGGGCFSLHLDFWVNLRPTDVAVTMAFRYKSRGHFSPIIRELPILVRDIKTNASPPTTIITTVIMGIDCIVWIIHLYRLKPTTVFERATEQSKGA